MYKFPTEQITASGQQAAEQISQIATSAFNGVEKMTELNLATSKSVLNDTLSSLQAVAGAKSPQEAMSAQAELLKPMAEKAAVYGKAAYAIAAETGAELTKASSGKLGDLQKTFGASFESMGQNLPAGTEPFMAAFKNAMATGQQMMESAQATVKQAASQVEANAAKATEAVIKAVNPAASK